MQAFAKEQHKCVCVCVNRYIGKLKGNTMENHLFGVPLVDTFPHCAVLLGPKPGFFAEPDLDSGNNEQFAGCMGWLFSQAKSRRESLAMKVSQRFDVLPAEGYNRCAKTA